MTTKKVWLVTDTRTTIRWQGGSVVCEPGERTPYTGPLHGLDGVNGIKVHVEVDDENKGAVAEDRPKKRAAKVAADDGGDE